MAPCPPRTRAGAPRRVGVELEFGELDVETTLGVVAETLGGTAELKDGTAGSVVGTELGEFEIELDSKPLQERSYLAPLEQLRLDENSRQAELIEDSVLRVARTVVPVEVVTPPVPWDRLSELDRLWEALRARGAQDTKGSVLYAFGLHLNPELPDLDVSTIVHTLSAYFLLEDWLAERIGVDFSRKVAPYVHPFPERYRRLVVDPSYAPDLRRFVEDYVRDNPTRNRTLDLLPLIRQAYSADLSHAIDDWDKVKPRPTFHYRLPNSELARPGWTPALDWNRWVEVERLAANPEALAALGAAYLDERGRLLPRGKSEWIELVTSTLPSLDEDETQVQVR